MRWLEVIQKCKEIFTFRGRWALTHFTPGVPGQRYSHLWWEWSWCALLTAIVLSLAYFMRLLWGFNCLLIIGCHREISHGRGRGEQVVTHFVERERGWKIVSELYLSCLVGDFQVFLGHMPTSCLWMRDGVQELSLGSTSWGWGSALMWKHWWTETEQMCLHDWTDRQTRQKTQKKERKGSQSFLPSRRKHTTCRGFLTKIHCLGGCSQAPWMIRIWTSASYSIVGGAKKIMASMAYTLRVM